MKLYKLEKQSHSSSTITVQIQTEECKRQNKLIFLKKYLLQSCYSYDISATDLNTAKERENTVNMVLKNKQTTVLCVLLLLAWNFARWGLKN